MASDTENYTPAMRQFFSTKEKYPDSVIFFRMGDFYETFFEDAQITARELDIVLTSRGTTPDGVPIPLAGIPYHALDTYLNKMIKKGHKVAICEQVEDPKLAKGVVKREVVRVVTPGTVTDEKMLEEGMNNYLMALIRDRDHACGVRYGMALADVSTGEFFATQLEGADVHQRLFSEIVRFKPTECILPPTLATDTELVAVLKEQCNVFVQRYYENSFYIDHATTTLCNHFQTATIEGLGVELAPLALIAAGAILDYLQETQMTSLKHINHLSTFSITDHMILDSTTLRNLEVIRNIHDGSSRGTLLSVLDRTMTAMGSRLLKKWLLQPLLNLESVQHRLDAVEEVANNLFVREDVRELLNGVSDLERLMGRIVLDRANARDLSALKHSLLVIPELKRSLQELRPKSQLLKRLRKNLKLGAHREIVRLIEKAIVDEPPISLKDGGLIKDGYNSQLDEYRDAMWHGTDWVRELERVEREQTGIKSLKVGFNKVFGYFIEVTKTNLGLVPEHYIRKQTLTNSERFITPELKDKEALILSAEEKSQALEFELFCELRSTIAGYSEQVQASAHTLAQLDVIFSLAEVAIRNDYCKPQVNLSDAIYIRDSRHPVVERLIKQDFIPNDTYIDCQDHQVLILTGPNMAGKSTYMRQVALTVILAQLGSFVPATSARIGLVDRVFTRVGAYDDLTRGQSTFMVEMIELANILTSATSRSLILLDEIGRGTSTYDGLGIAWAVVEYIHHKEHLGAKTIFATHYHHLNELSNVMERVRNYHIAVKEDKDTIIFLYKVVPGGTDKSYGIEVAKLAGVPQPVISRAKEILQRIEEEYLIETRAERSPRRGPPSYMQLEFLKPPEEQRTATTQEASVPAADNVSAPVQEIPGQDVLVKHPVLEELRGMDVMNLTPLQALTVLHELQKKLEELESESSSDSDSDSDSGS